MILFATFLEDIMEYYYTIEVEVTNFCNANCVFCANSKLSRKRGYIDVFDFEHFILTQKEHLKSNIFYKKNISQFPKINFCGLGDPLLHPQIDRLIGIAHENGFYTQIVTNGNSLTPELLKRICDSGLDEIAISLHSLDENIFNKITGLSLDKVKNNIEKCAYLIEKKHLKFSIWRIYHPDEHFRKKNDEKEYNDFLKGCGITEYSILGPSEPWYRDGVVPMSKCCNVNDKPFWCNKIIFTLYIDWQGNVVICCNDYNRETFDLGNVFDAQYDYNKLMQTRIKILKKEIVPDICKQCRRWEDNEIMNIIKIYDMDITEFERITEE